MLSRISLWTGLIGIGVTIAIVQPAIAKTSVEIAETAKAITVLITEPGSVGSGVILQQSPFTVEAIEMKIMPKPDLISVSLSIALRRWRVTWESN